MTNEMNRLKLSLADMIQQWIDDNCESNGWNDLDISIGDLTVAIMADSAFNVLLGMKDMKEYMFQSDQLKED